MRSTNRLFVRFLQAALLLLAFSVFASPASAQNAATLEVAVFDPSGAAVADAAAVRTSRTAGSTGSAPGVADAVITRGRLSVRTSTSMATPRLVIAANGSAAAMVTTVATIAVPRVTGRRLARALSSAATRPSRSDRRAIASIGARADTDAREARTIASRCPA